MKGAPLFVESCRSAAAALLSAGATCWACAGERVLVPAWLTLANYVSLLLYVLLLFERLTEVIFHLAACLLPAFVYVLLALLISLVSMPPEASPGAPIPDGGAGVPRQQVLAQQQLVRSLLRSSSTPADASATGTRSSTWKMAALSSLKKDSRHFWTARLYPLASAPSASLLPSSSAHDRVSPPAAGVGRVVLMHQNGGGHSNSLCNPKSTPSNRLPSGGTSTGIGSKRRRTILQVKKRAVRPHDVMDMPPGDAWKRYYDAWKEASSMFRETNAEVRGGAASGRRARAEMVDTAASESGKATAARRGFESWQGDLRHMPAASATAATPAAPVSACGEPASVARGKAEHTSHSAQADGEHVCGRKLAAFTAPRSIKNLSPADLAAAKVTRDADREQRMIDRTDIKLTYDATDRKASFSTAVEVIASRDGITVADRVRVGGEAWEPATQNAGTQLPRHAGANGAADAAPAGTASEAETAEEGKAERRESERRGGKVWLVALVMEYGYVILSHVSRGLLLELPVYSFALYLSQLLRVQGISFSAGPSSIPAAEDVGARRRALYSANSTGQAGSTPESSTPPNINSGSTHRSSAFINGPSRTSSTNGTTRSSNDSCCRISSHCGWSAEKSSRDTRRLRSEVSWRPNHFEKGIRNRRAQSVKRNGVAALCSTEFRLFKNAPACSKWGSADLPASIGTGGSTGDDRGYSVAICMAVEAGAAAQMVRTAVAGNRRAEEDAHELKAQAGSLTGGSSTVREVHHPACQPASSGDRLRRRRTSVGRCDPISAAAAQDIKHIWGSEEPHLRRRDGCSNERGFPQYSWDKCLPTPGANSGIHTVNRTRSENAAGDGSEPTARTNTAVEAAAVDVPGGRAAPERFQQRRRERHFDEKMNTAVLGAQRTAGTTAAGETGGSEDEAGRAAVEGGDEEHASAGGGRQSDVVTTAAETQSARVTLRAAEKELGAGALMKTAGGLPAGAAQQDQHPYISGDVPAADTRAAQSETVPAVLAARRAANWKPSAAAQALRERKDGCAVVESTENNTTAPRASTGDTEVLGDAMTEGTGNVPREGGLERVDKEPQRDEQAVSAGARGTPVCLLPLRAKETRDVFAGKSCGYSSGTKVVTQCTVEDSDTTGDSSNNNLIPMAGVVQTNRRHTCTTGSRASKESCWVSNAEGWKKLGSLSSDPVERGAQALPDCAAYAAAEAPDVEYGETTIGGRACPPHGVLQRSIALLVRYLVKLQCVLRSKVRGVFWRCSCRLAAVVTARGAQSVLMWFGFRGKLVRALHPLQLLSLSPVHFFPNTSQRLIFTTCCFWLLRGLHGDILLEHGNSPSPGSASPSGSPVNGWAGSQVLLERSNSFIKRDDNHGSTDTDSVGMTNTSGGSRSGSHASGCRNQRRRDELLWRGRSVDADVLPSQARSDSARDSSSFLLYYSGRDTHSTFATPREPTRIEPSASFLDKRSALVSAGRSRHSRSQRMHQKARSFTWSSYGEYPSTHFLWMYPLLLKTCRQVREYLQPLRQWTAWLALLLLLLLLISYSLLSLSSTFEILPWQLLHVLVVLRHTRLCTYAARMMKNPKFHLPEKQDRAQRFSGTFRKKQDVNEKKLDKRPLQAAVQAQKRVESDTSCTSGHEPKGEDGVDAEKSCIFCFEAFVSTDVLRLVNACGHIFHRRCMDTWLFQKKKKTCPFCGPFRNDLHT